ncbi:MAG: hypothetical protein AMXMBFR53_38930 [Gemmatimonadota bacterium]
MEHRISATELARNVGDVLGRIRYRGESFLVERNGEVVARIAPAPGQPVLTVREAAALWRDTADPKDDFAADLERVGLDDRPPEDPWAS